MDEKDFERYLSAFNDRDYDTLVSYYDDDVQLALPATSLTGPAGIRAHYEQLHQTVREILRVDWKSLSASGVAFDCYTEFHALEDAPNLSMGALAKGQVLKCTNFVHSEVRNGKFVDIRVAKYRIWDIGRSKLL